MMFGLGAIAGPLVASSLMAEFGAHGVFVFTAAVHVALAAFALYRMTRRARPPEEERTAFSALPAPSQTSPTVFQLDPRSAPAAGDEGVTPGRVPTGSTEALVILPTPLPPPAAGLPRPSDPC